MQKLRIATGSSSTRRYGKGVSVLCKSSQVLLTTAGQHDACVLAILAQPTLNRRDPLGRKDLTELCHRAARPLGVRPVDLALHTGRSTCQACLGVGLLASWQSALILRSMRPLMKALLNASGKTTVGTYPLGDLVVLRLRRVKPEGADAMLVVAVLQHRPHVIHRCVRPAQATAQLHELMLGSDREPCGSSADISFVWPRRTSRRRALRAGHQVASPRPEGSGCWVGSSGAPARSHSRSASASHSPAACRLQGTHDTIRAFQVSKTESAREQSRKRHHRTREASVVRERPHGHHHLHTKAVDFPHHGARVGPVLSVKVPVPLHLPVHCHCVASVSETAQQLLSLGKHQ